MIILITQDLVAIVLCAFKRIKGRFAFALDTLERAAPCGRGMRLFGAVQPSPKVVKDPSLFRLMLRTARTVNRFGLIPAGSVQF